MELFFQSMAYPFLACLVLTGIHVYLGIHVIERKVIFVDLALATIAALGAVWGALLGWDIHDDVWAIKGFSLAFTFVGAAIFSVTRMRHERVPHEAIIGITYAVALAAMILGSAKLPHGAEEVRDLQAGSILWVSGSTIAWTALLYAIIGAFHFVFRRQFFALSMDPDRAEAEGMHVRFWDFLFYVSFGFVVTSSVSIAGVLLVFSYLVIPSVVAVLFADRIGVRLAIGWSVGTVVSATGVVLSYYGDLPSGPVIVVCFGAFLIGAGILHFFMRTQARVTAVLRLAGGLALALLFVRGTLLFEKKADLDVAHVLETGNRNERVMMLGRVRAEPELWSEIEPLAPGLLRDADISVRLALLSLITEQRRQSMLDPVLALLTDPDDIIREQALKCVRTLDRPESVDAILHAASLEPDEYLRVEMAEAVLELGDRRGIPLLLQVMDEGEAEQARRDAFEHLQAHVALALPYHAETAYAGHAGEMQALREWWQREGASIRLIEGGTPGEGE